MGRWSHARVVLVVIVAVLAVSGSILVWTAQYHHLGQTLVGAAVVIGVVVPAVLKSRQQPR